MRPNESERRYSFPDPTPEEIRERCAEIQAEWDEHTERVRRLGVAMAYVEYEIRKDVCVVD